MTRFFGWNAVAICSVAWLWLSGPGGAAQTASISVGNPTGAIEEPLAVSDTDARISYPVGDYPRLLLSNGETRQIHSILNVSHVLRVGEYVWNVNGVPPGRIWIRIDLARQMLSVFRGGDEIGTTLVIYGSRSKPTPVGTFHIMDRSRHYYSHTYHAPMPYALRLTTDGVALHATNVRQRFASHGCIGLPTVFARLLFAAASRGDAVDILPAQI